MSRPGPIRVLAFATQGSGGDDEHRLRRLTSNLNPTFFGFAHASKWKSFTQLLRLMRERTNDVAIMEGTGLAGGAALLLGKLMFGLPYVLSSGDAIAPFLAAKYPLGAPFFRLYEKLLCHYCAGFVGWTPYLVGRALTLGAPRGMTAPGWAPFKQNPETRRRSRVQLRAKLGIPTDALVFGIAGSLTWSRRYKYCYGLELVQAALKSERADLRVLIVGDGEGLPYLKQMAGLELGERIIFTGRVAREQVPGYLAAMDVGSLPQSVDGVGNFRYTTKVSEYIAAGLPFVTGQIPAAYDLGLDCLWRLRGSAPWDPQFLSDLTRLMDSVTLDNIHAKSDLLPGLAHRFDECAQVASFTAFVRDVLEERRQP
ncbi:hypothetical protein F183_A28970 [Bryobacterales bacterium F-183]|nr:hypothetical protein F183_A28970 [Bryobacterales bacterium F-183]